MPTTSRGAPYPGDGPGVPNDVPGDLKLLAEWASDRPGVTTMSSATRSALGPAERWEGRLIYETDTNRLLVRLMGAWRLLSREDTLGGEWQSVTLTYSGSGIVTPGSTQYYRMRRVGKTITLKGAVQIKVTDSVGTAYFSYPPGGVAVNAEHMLLGWAHLGGGFTAGSMRPVLGLVGKLAIPVESVSDQWLRFHAEYEVAT